ncbi:hypothetical protein AVEN_242510-1 [Araneus ventricosus]|uniref:Uncharacterized protein n=1 Tax=Araneus ventricosus TaxID=182803 RepID=A0A4Y2VBY2_ARAVE|nr:hypothetical protein AVEN_242510-1 [Araneus ventricosus]
MTRHCCELWRQFCQQNLSQASFPGAATVMNHEWAAFPPNVQPLSQSLLSPPTTVNYEWAAVPANVTCHKVLLPDSRHCCEQKSSSANRNLSQPPS